MIKRKTLFIIEVTPFLYQQLITLCEKSLKDIIKEGNSSSNKNNNKEFSMVIVKENQCFHRMVKNQQDFYENSLNVTKIEPICKRIKRNLY